MRYGFSVGELVTLKTDDGREQESYLILPDKPLYDGYVVALKNGKIKVQLSRHYIKSLSKVKNASR